MNRRSFLRNLALGAAALPVAVKAATAARLEPQAPWFNGEKWHVHDGLEYKALEVDDVTRAFAEQYARLMQEVVRRVAYTDPYANLLSAHGITANEIEALNHPIYL